MSFVRQITKDEKGNNLEIWGYHTDPVAFNEDGTLAFIAGRNGKIYIVDTSIQNVVYTLQVKGNTANISSIVANDGWLYIAEGTNQLGQGRLLRVLIDSSSSEYLKVQQQILAGTAENPLGFQDMALNFGRYLAVTSLRQNLRILNGAYFGYNIPAQAGNVYILDLASISSKGEVPSDAIVTIGTNFPVVKQGKSPEYVTAGFSAGEFLISSARDYNRGITGITVGIKNDGTLDGTVKGASTLLRATEANWLKKQMQQNVQRAAETVLTYYDGKLYALVADYNFVYNDPHFLNDDQYGKQIGGKIAVIEDPFGYEGEPKYLGATTPIVGGAISHLSLSRTGMLQGDVWFDEEITENGGTFWRMQRSMLVWDAGGIN